MRWALPTGLTSAASGRDLPGRARFNLSVSLVALKEKQTVLVQEIALMRGCADEPRGAPETQAKSSNWIVAIREDSLVNPEKLLRSAQRVRRHPPSRGRQLPDVRRH